MIILSEINTLDELRAKGTFNQVKASINKLIPIKARGWKHLWQKIIDLRKYAENVDVIHTALFFNTKDIKLTKKYLWLVTVTRRKYNFYISSKYEDIDYFESKGA